MLVLYSVYLVLTSFLSYLIYFLNEKQGLTSNTISRFFVVWKYLSSTFIFNYSLTWHKILSHKGFTVAHWYSYSISPRLWWRTHTHAHMPHVYTHMHVHKCTMCVHTHTCMHILMHTYHMCMYIHTHTCTHTQRKASVTVLSLASLTYPKWYIFSLYLRYCTFYV